MCSFLIQDKHDPKRIYIKRVTCEGTDLDVKADLHVYWINASLLAGNCKNWITFLLNASVLTDKACGYAEQIRMLGFCMEIGQQFQSPDKPLY